MGTGADKYSLLSFHDTADADDADDADYDDEDDEEKEEDYMKSMAKSFPSTRKIAYGVMFQL